ncbi:PRELI domain-containing protein 1, mitochondrial isoform X1 [Petromyzon marinus]|uniref:PRELI domain-containing protein 1, mitochondrial isoform X1 n=1 Tax=Petromyzon marinus TaxID=7757 RepID=A0AAJ7SX58_PETMA|nr:PRELI domain-containing protein 1, mitochondrial isoform X1 [Petromyzon marinus]
MVKYYACLGILKSSWDHVFAAFWQRYPNPYSKHVLTEDVLWREVTEDKKLLTRRLLSKTNRLPKWAERLLPSHVAPRHVYILEDSVMDAANQRLITFTRNVNHTRLMVVKERCEYTIDPEQRGWTQIKRQAWICSSVYGFSRPIQEFGVARFKSNVSKAMKGFEYILTSMQALSSRLPPAGDPPARSLKATAMEATERAKDLACKAAAPQKAKQFL